MPRIRDDYLDSVIYLYPSRRAAGEGRRIGGSGFLVGWRTSDPPVEHVYAVTCAHVVADGNPVIRLNTKDGEYDIIEREKADWLDEPGGTDIAVCPVDLSDNHKYHQIGINDFVIERTIEEFAIGPGDDVFMAGRFINHEGVQRNLPTLRFGNIAMMPDEPVKGWQGVPQESYLIDMRSRSGYSGSPVFVYIAPTEIRLGLRHWTTEQSETFFGPWLLGVDWGHLPIHAKVLGPTRDTHGNRIPVDKDWDVPMISGMNAVTPAWALLEHLMNDPDLNEARRQKHENVAKGGYGVLDSASPEQELPTTADNPDHREDFNRLLDAAASGNKQGSETS